MYAAVLYICFSLGTGGGGFEWVAVLDRVQVQLGSSSIELRVYCVWVGSNLDLVRFCERGKFSRSFQILSPYLVLLLFDLNLLNGNKSV